MPDDGGPQRARDARVAAVAGVALSAAGLLVADLASMWLRAPALPAGAARWVFAGIGLACGIALGAPIALVRAEARVRTERFGRAASAVWGAVDAVALYFVAVVLGRPRAIAGRTMELVALVFAIGIGAIVGAATARGRRLARIGAAGGVAWAAYFLVTLRWNSQDAYRLSAHAVLGASMGLLLRPFARRLSWPALVIVACTSLVAVAASGPILAASPAARAILHLRSSHAKSWANVLESASDLDGDGAGEILGARDCDPARADVFGGATERPGDGIDENCSGGDGARPTAAAPDAAFGSARGRDVILLSFDSLRADAADALAPAVAQMGPTARFDLAVSPSPQTRFSLPATLRGRPVRALRFHEGRGVRGLSLSKDRSPTIGDVLVRAGYHAFTVITTEHLDPRIGVASGFDSLESARGLAVLRPPSPFSPRRFTRAPTALRKALGAARRVRGPICIWLHLMDSHYPYFRGPSAHGPRTHEALRRSAAWLAGLAARFLADLSRVRPRPPVVAIWGDHGEAFGEHGVYLHASSVQAEQVRVGFVLSGPGVVAGRFGAPVSTTALAPTVLEMLGIAAPRAMMEASLLGPMGGRAPWPEVAVSEISHAVEFRHDVGYTGAHWRLVRDPVHDVEALFDLVHDPGETRDVSAPEPAARREMERLAHAWDERR